MNPSCVGPATVGSALERSRLDPSRVVIAGATLVLVAGVGIWLGVFTAVRQLLRGCRRFANSGLL